MSTLTTKKQKGFTIIEVALVLAVAALIFLVVFLAVPALQRNQRNDARKRDVANVVQAISAWQSNNNNAALSAVGISGNAVTGDLADYLDNVSNNVTTMTLISGTTIATNADADALQIYSSAKCENSNTLVPAAARQYAVGMWVETGGAPTFFCQ